MEETLFFLASAPGHHHFVPPWIQEKEKVSLLLTLTKY